MRKGYIWEIKANNTPLLKRKCNHCHCDRFYCSDRFRMNSQKRNIDVWLVYRCSKCDNTYNVTILSHGKPETIRKDLFLKFSENDKETAWEYAFSSEIARKNNIEFDYDSIEYEIQNEGISIDDLQNSHEEYITFRIVTLFDFRLKLSSVLRIGLELTTSQLNQMIEKRAISIPEIQSIKKHRVKNGDTILICKDELISRLITK